MSRAGWLWGASAFWCSAAAREQQSAAAAARTPHRPAHGLTTPAAVDRCRRASCRAACETPQGRSRSAGFEPSSSCLALAAALYARRARTLARRGLPVPRRRLAAFAAGSLVLLVALVSPSTRSARSGSSPCTCSSTCCSATSARCCSCSGWTDGCCGRSCVRSHARLRVLAHPLVALPLWAANFCVWHLPSSSTPRLATGHALQHCACSSRAGSRSGRAPGPPPGPAGTGWVRGSHPSPWFGSSARRSRTSFSERHRVLLAVRPRAAHLGSSAARRPACRRRRDARRDDARRRGRSSSPSSACAGSRTPSGASGAWRLARARQVIEREPEAEQEQREQAEERGVDGGLAWRARVPAVAAAQRYERPSRSPSTASVPTPAAAK